MKTSKEQHYTMLDLAVPRDIDPSIVDKYEVNYLDVASLEDKARENMAFRQEEVVHAESILESFMKEFEVTYKQRQLERAMSEIPQKVKALHKHAVDEVFSKEIDGLDEDAKKVLSDVLSYFEKKYIGIPMKIVKKTILDDDKFKD